MTLNVNVVLAHNHDGHNCTQVNFRNRSIFAEEDVKHFIAKEIDTFG